MSQVELEKLNCKDNSLVDCDTQPLNQDNQLPIVWVSQKKKKRLKTFPKFPKSKKSVLVIPTFVEGQKIENGQ